MFGLFKQKYFLGIDFGMFSIKIVELKITKDEVFLVNFGIADVREDSAGGASNAVSHEMLRIQYLEALVRQMRPHTQEAFVSLPGSSGLISILEIPKMSQKELAEAIQFEAHKYVPVDINDVAISWDIIRPLGEGERSSTTMQKVLLVAALKKDVDRTASSIEKAGMTVSAMELEIFALARSLTTGRTGAHLIIDVGFRVTNLVIVGGGDVRMNRNVDVGGNDVTRTIMEGMNIVFDRAEALKKERDFFHQNEIPLSFPSIEIILAEAKRMISAFDRQESSPVPIDSVILSGGTAQLPGFAVYCQETLGIPVEMGDPWKHLRYDTNKLTESGKRELGGSLSIALGLALRGKTI